LQKRPDAEALVLWLADAVLATASDGREARRRRIRRSDFGAAAHDYDRPQPPPFVRTFGRDRAARGLTGRSMQELCPWPVVTLQAASVTAKAL